MTGIASEFGPPPSTVTHRRSRNGPTHRQWLSSRELQELVGASSSGFKSPLPHQTSLAKHASELRLGKPRIELTVCEVCLAVAAEPRRRTSRSHNELWLASHSTPRNGLSRRFRKRISPGGRRRLVNLSRARVVLARSAGAGKSRESLLPHESICPRKLRYESFENLFLAIRKNGWILKSSRDALDAGNLFHATIPVDTANAVQSSSPESGTRTLLNITAAE